MQILTPNRGLQKTVQILPSFTYFPVLKYFLTKSFKKYKNSKLRRKKPQKNVKKP